MANDVLEAVGAELGLSRDGDTFIVFAKRVLDTARDVLGAAVVDTGAPTFETLTVIARHLGVSAGSTTNGSTDASSGGASAGVSAVAGSGADRGAGAADGARARLAEIRVEIQQAIQRVMQARTGDPEAGDPAVDHVTGAIRSLMTERAAVQQQIAAAGADADDDEGAPALAAAAAAAAAADPLYPTHWEPFGDEGEKSSYAGGRKWKLVDVNAESEEFNRVAARLLMSMNGVNIEAVQRVQSRALWRQYSEKRDDLIKKCDGIGVEPNADLELWHGTGATDPEEILRSESGLDERFSNDGLYGRGVYLAKFACYSNGDDDASRVRCYAHQDATGNRKLFLVMAVPGHLKDMRHQPYDTEMKQLFPKKLVDWSSSTKELQITFDAALCGPQAPGHSGPGPNQSEILVVARGAQVYPAYWGFLIT